MQLTRTTVTAPCFGLVIFGRKSTTVPVERSHGKKLYNGASVYFLACATAPSIRHQSRATALADLAAPLEDNGFLAVYVATTFVHESVAAT